MSNPSPSGIISNNAYPPTILKSSPLPSPYPPLVPPPHTPYLIPNNTIPPPYAPPPPYSMSNPPPSGIIYNNAYPPPPPYTPPSPNSKFKPYLFGIAYPPPYSGPSPKFGFLSPPPPTYHFLSSPPVAAVYSPPAPPSPLHVTPSKPNAPLYPLPPAPLPPAYPPLPVPGNSPPLVFHTNFTANESVLRFITVNVWSNRTVEGEVIDTSTSSKSILISQKGPSIEGVLSGLEIYGSGSNVSFIVAFVDPSDLISVSLLTAPALNFNGTSQVQASHC